MDRFGHVVFANDAEDIKAHGWFKHFAWEPLLWTKMPFVPNLTSAKDTHYFEESETPDDWPESRPPAHEEAQHILQGFRPYVQHVAARLVAEPHGSVSLRKINFELENSPELSDEETEALKQFLRLWGQRERRWPRDVLLRDVEFKDAVMEVRKTLAFVGYSWRRMPPKGFVMPAPHQ